MDPMKTLVIGQSWSALLVAAAAVVREETVVWVQTGSHGLYPAASGWSADNLNRLLAVLGKEAIPLRPAAVLEWKSDAFRDLRTPLSGYEALLVDTPQASLEGPLDLWTLCESIIAADGKLIVRPDREFIQAHKAEFSKIYFCGRPSEISEFPEMKAELEQQLPGPKNPEFGSLLQWVAQSNIPLPDFSGATLLVNLPRESGDTVERRAIGRCVEPNKMVWTTVIHADEAEDNHSIMKRLKKMKAAYRKILDAENIGQISFEDTVRFESGVLFPSSMPHRKAQGDGCAIWVCDGVGQHSLTDRLVELFPDSPNSKAQGIDDQMIPESFTQDLSDSMNRSS
jgi:hypothetical protein